MTKEIEILMRDGCTKRVAMKSLMLGTEIYDEESVYEFIDEYNASAYDDEDMITKAGIEQGDYADIRCIEVEDERYYIAYAN